MSATGNDLFSLCDKTILITGGTRGIGQAIPCYSLGGSSKGVLEALACHQRDHIFEFHNENDPIKMAEEVGLRVTRLVCDAGLPAPGGRFLPRALAMVLRRR